MPRWVYGPALAGLAIVVVPLLALLPRVHWATFWSDISEPATFAALTLSTKCALLAVVLCVVFGVPLALIIARAPAPLGVVLRTIVTLPLVLPPLVGGVALLAVLGRTGIIGPWLDGLGITVPFTPAAVVVAQTFVAMPFLVISVEGALRAAGTDYEEVAAGLGAGRGRILTRITLPLIMPGLLAGIVLAFARSVGEFGATALLAGNKPGVTQTIPMAIYTAFNGVGTSRQAAMALSVLLIATALAVLLIFPVARGSSAAVVSAGRAAEPDNAEPAPEIPASAPAAGDEEALTTTPRGKRLGVDVQFARPGFRLAAELEAEPGAALAIVGPNAAGKSTLVNLIAGNLRPRRGVIAIDGEELSTPDRVVPPNHRHVGVLSQRPLLFPHLNVVENVAFGPRSRGVKKATAHAQARELLAHVGMANTALRRPGRLSGGQQQRVALARALATEPSVLLLDEPMAALDVATAPHIRRILAQEIARTQVTAVVVTHDVLDVVGLAERVVVIENGEVAENRAVADFLARPTSAFGAALTGVNVLPDPQTGQLLHLGPGELTLDQSADPRPGWPAVVELIEVSGAQALVRASVGNRFVTLGCEVDVASDLLPGQRVRITRLPARVEA